MENILQEPSEQQSEEAIHEPRSSRGFMSVDSHQTPSTSRESNSRKNVSAVHGNIYQVKYLMLILYRAWKRGQPFCLNTEVEGAGAFDDVVLDYRDDSGNEVRSFVQLKHKLDGRRTISARDLLADDIKDKSFCVLKYFKSWRKIKDDPKFIAQKSKHFILFTNMALDVKSLKDEKIDIHDYVEVNDIDNESESEVRKFDEFLIVMDKEEPTPLYNLRPEKGSKLHRKLDSVSDVNVLARELAQCVHKNKKIDQNTAIFRDYSAALAKEIIDTNSRKLRLGFVENDNLSEKAKKFRSIFLEKMTTLFQCDKMDSSDENIWKELEKKTLNISGKFCGKPHSETTSRELPDDDMSNKEIFNFFGEFVWAVHQPNEEDLGEMIRSEIDDDSTLNHLDAHVVVGALQKYMLDWLKQKSRNILAKEDANNFFNEIEVKLSFPIAKHLSAEYTKKLDEYGIKFESKNIEVRKFVNSSDSTTEQRLAIINSCETFLTALWVYQTLMPDPKSETDDSVLFITLKSLLLIPETKKAVSAVFKWPHNHNWLIVDCESISAEQCRDKMWDSLDDIMKKNTNKKMILIIQGTDESKIPFKNSYKVLLENKNDYNINSLEKSSQQKLLKRNVVKFQGKEEECFGRLFGIDIDNIESEKLTDLGQIINSEILLKIMKNKEIDIGVYITGLSKTELSHYIPRKIDRHVVIKEDFLQVSGMDDLLAIGVSDNADLIQLVENKTGLQLSDHSSQIDSQRRVCFDLDHGRESHHFKQLCEQNADRNIHWLQRVSGILIWIRSHGDVSNLVEYKDRNQGNLDEDIISRILSATLANDEKNEVIDDRDQLGATSLDEDGFAVFDKQRRIVILSDIAGMGKTTILTYLARGIQEKQPSSLVITINLRLHTPDLKNEVENRSFDSNNADGAVDFLVDKLGGPGTDLERQVYKKILNGDGEAALLFDGFDELSLTHGHIVVELLQALVKKISIKKIIVTTRPHTSEALETKLRTFSYSLQSFSPENQKDFVKNFWKRGMSGNYSDETLEARLELRAERVIKLLDKSVRRQMMDFTGVPLQLMMLAHIYRYRRTVEGDASDDADERIAVEDIEAELPEKMDIIDLYEKFVDEKFNILLEEKQSGDSTNQSAMSSHESHRDISFMQHQKFALEELFENQIVRMLLTSQPDVQVCIARLGKSNTDAERIGLVTLDSEGKPQFIHRTFAEYFAATFLTESLKDDSRNQQAREFFVAELFLKPQYKTIRAFLDCLLLKSTDAVKNESWKLDLNEKEHRDELGRTVFHVAVVEYNFDIIKFFINRLGGSVAESTLASLSLRRVRYTLYRYLRYFLETLLGGHSKNDSEKQDTGINIRDRDNLSPLAMVIRGVYGLDEVKLLVEGGADIHWKDISHAIHRTLLHISVVKPDNFEIVKYLCDEGANPNCQNGNRETPLHLAALSRHANLEVVKYLCQKGANPNCQNKDNRTPLHFAVSIHHHDNLEVVKYLCQQGANPNCQTKHNNTPLHLHVSGLHDANLKVVKYLCHKGANPNCQNADNDTPLHLAVDDHRRDPKLNVVKYLSAIISHNNHEGEDGVTPLHRAVTVRNNLEVVKYLCERIADINQKDKLGRTPLHRALLRPNNFELVECLCERGADISREDQNGMTPLHYAVACPGRLPVVEYLCNNGASVNCRDIFGKNPLDVAVLSHNDPAIVNYLRRKVAEKSKAEGTAESDVVIPKNLST